MLETRFGTFEFVILKLFRVSDFVLWILCWFRLVAWTETFRFNRGRLNQQKDAKRNKWNLAIPRLHEDKFRVFRGQNKIPW